MISASESCRTDVFSVFGWYRWGQQWLARGCCQDEVLPYVRFFRLRCLTGGSKTGCFLTFLQYHIKFIVILLWRSYWWRSPLRLQPDIWIMSGSKQPPRSPPAAGCPSLSLFFTLMHVISKVTFGCSYVSSRPLVLAAALLSLTVWGETPSCCTAEPAGNNAAVGSQSSSHQKLFTLVDSCEALEHFLILPFEKMHLEIPNSSSAATDLNT